ncbi:hypothetical protein C5S31_01730, partial [ANME-1 cluster archaeon GoMg2]|nr:hypothetical protein [ANME-1 cluster archaeon GoMg2]
MLNKIKFILVSLFAVCIAVSAFALPETFLIYGFVNNSNGAAVLNPDVTITNLNTSEVFTTEVDDNYYQVSTSSRSVSTGNTLHFTVRDNGNIVGRDHTVTDEDINNGGLFNFNVTSESAEMSQFFDTGEAANPYPSISGIHNGTITPKVTIRNLSRLYTYPCPGTGGHTEYVAFWHSNGTRITEGLWNGYTDDDWHNISFPAFTMHADDTYKYSIRTGSYPQIIHNQTHTNGYGTINCTEFTDANGRSYTDRIPAIRLEAYFVPAAAGYTNPKSAFSSHYDPVNITADPCVPSYDLPITNLTKITNYQDIMSVFGPSALNNTPFRTNGFVIRDYGDVRDIVAPYEDMKAQDIPIFVTADTLLHLYHIQFNEILKGIEEREFFDSLVDTSNAMLEQSKTDYETFDDQEMKEAARRNVAYFSVALTLLQTSTEGYNSRENIKEVSFTIPDYVKDEVDTEIENIEGHEGFKPSVVFNTNPNCVCGYPCCYCEDYSQYVPRGHYTRSEKLKRYFKAMMWYGRMAFLLKGCNGDEALISGQDANTSTIQAALISSELPEVKVGTKTAQDTWNRIYAVTAFFVGNADDLTPYEYANAMNNVFGADYNLSELSDEANLLTLKAELAKMRSPEIYGGSGVCVVYPPITEEKLYECLDKTKGMRFMGQRFVPDSYMFQHLVSPAVGMYVGNDTPFTMCITDLGTARCFPRGLDVMAVLGSERAEDILREEGDTEYESIITNDGRLLFPQGIDIVKLKDMEQQQEAENRSRAQKEQKRTIGNFIVSSDEICREDGKPIIYFFCSDACGHCKWEHPVIVNVTSNFEGYISFHDN